MLHNQNLCPIFKIGFPECSTWVCVNHSNWQFSNKRNTCQERPSPTVKHPQFQISRDFHGFPISTSIASAPVDPTIGPGIVVNQLGTVEISIDLVQVALHGKGIGLRKVHRDGRTSQVQRPAGHRVWSVEGNQRWLPHFTTKDGEFANVRLNQLWEVTVGTGYIITQIWLHVCPIMSCTGTLLS